MKVLVIPDVHLKPWMFDRATELMNSGVADKAVCLMDIPDDFRKQHDVNLYAHTFDKAIEFSKNFPETLWCYGNHDVCYLWNFSESGYSILAARTVREKLAELKESLVDETHIAFIHKIDNVLFLHGGLTDDFVKKYTNTSDYNNPDEVVNQINTLSKHILWEDNSPLWFRPQYRNDKLYKPRKLLQVVGHTPVEYLRKDRSVISCDLFSTYTSGDPFGTQEFCVVDTVTKEFYGIK